MRSASIVGAVVAGLALMASVACKAPTEIVLDIRTDADCSNPAAWRGVAVYAGHPGDDVESKAPALTTKACQAGSVGTLTIVPSSAKDEQIGIRVVAGLARNPEDCRAASYGGCIVSRRALRFEPGQSVSVVVDLTTDCTGLGCDDLHSCLNGACVASLGPSLVAPPTDGGAAAVGPTVRCGDNAAQCPTTGDVCCLTIAEGGTTRGDCRDVKACPPTSAVLYCDDDSDCRSLPSDPNDPLVCCMAGAAGYCNFGSGKSSGTQCVPASKCNGSTVVCEDRKPCGNGKHLCEVTDALPGYHSCCFYEGP